MKITSIGFFILIFGLLGCGKDSPFSRGDDEKQTGNCERWDLKNVAAGHATIGSVGYRRSGGNSGLITFKMQAENYRVPTAVQYQNVSTGELLNIDCWVGNSNDHYCLNQEIELTDRDEGSLPVMRIKSITFNGHPAFQAEKRTVGCDLVNNVYGPNWVYFEGVKDDGFRPLYVK